VNNKFGDPCVVRTTRDLPLLYSFEARTTGHNVLLCASSGGDEPSFDITAVNPALDGIKA
jgi:hypothetical protein